MASRGEALAETAMGAVVLAAAAGFASIRAFNTTVGEVFALSPTELRRRAKGRSQAGAPGVLPLRLPFRGPLWPDNLFGHLAATGVPGVEEWRNGSYRRTLRLPHGPGIVELTPPQNADSPATGHIPARLRLTDLRDLARWLSRQLEREYEYLTSDEAVDEMIAVNGHTFTEAGRRFG